MSPDPSRWPGEMVLSKRSGIVLLLRDDDVGSGNFDLAGSYHTKSKSKTIKLRRIEGQMVPSHSPALLQSTHDGGAAKRWVLRRPRRSARRRRWRRASTSGGYLHASESGSCGRRSPRSAREGGHRQTGKACPFEALVNPGRPRPPQTTRRGHRVAEQLLGAHRRPFWARSGGKVLGAFGGDPSKLDDLPKYLLLHDVHTRPVRAPPTGLAADIPSGCLELELLQEIPVI